MKKLLFIANIAKPEVEMINILYEKLLEADIELHLLLFKTHNADILSLKPNKFVFNHSLPTKMFFHHSLERENDFAYDDYFNIDLKLHDNINKVNYKKTLNLFYNDFMNALDSYSIEYVILNHHLDGIFEFIKNILKERDIKYIEYMRWSFTKYYKFSNHLFDRDIDLDLEINGSSLVDFPKMSFKYSDSRNVFKSDRPYVLLLDGGYELGTQVESSKYYKSRGYSWGSDEEIVKKFITLWDEEKYKFDLIVRQHPYNIFKINFDNFSKHKFIHNGADYDLEKLILNAKVTISGHTTLVEHLLLSNNKLLFLGNHEFCDYCMTCLKNIAMLKNALNNLNEIPCNHNNANKVLQSYYQQYVLNIDDSNSISNIVKKITANVPGTHQSSVNKQKLTWIFQVFRYFNILKNAAIYYAGNMKQGLKKIL